MKSFGERVKKARLSHTPSMTQKVLSEKTGISQAHISRIEKDTYKGTPAIIELSKALEVNIEWLVNGYGTMKDITNKNNTNLDRLIKSIENNELTNEEIEKVIDNAIIHISKLR